MTPTHLLVRRARIVPADPHLSALAGVVDLVVSDGYVAHIAPQGMIDAADLRRSGSLRVIDADGRWAIPGLWDQHVHLGQWAESSVRLDLTGTSGPAEALQRVAARSTELQREAVPLERALIGVGFRASEWTAPASVAALDRVTGERPAVLISGDAHSGWLNSAALQLLGMPARETALYEGEWFEVFPRVADLPSASPDSETLLRTALKAALRRGVVGITDFEFGSPYQEWEERSGAGLDLVRVRAGVYPHDLAEVLGRGLRTGTSLGGNVTLGPLKIISDGSLGTLTAYCCEPYGTDATHPQGKWNVDGAELRRLLTAARAGRLEVALHTIGDLAAAEALDAFEATGAQGSIEHAQLLRREDLPRMAALGLAASVQPAHLLDDRDVTDRVWADRADRSFMLRSLLDSGVELALGSDAPVAPLDPWLTIDAAVHRAHPGDDAWFSEERISAAEALFSSTDGQGPLIEGSRGDLVLLDRDPLTERQRDVRVDATVIAGSVAHDGISHK